MEQTENCLNRKQFTFPPSKKQPNSAIQKGKFHDQVAKKFRLVSGIPVAEIAAPGEEISQTTLL